MSSIQSHDEARILYPVPPPPLQGEFAAPKNGLNYEVLCYERVSSEEKHTGSHTFETQELRAREWMDRRLGAGNYNVKTLRDDGISGGIGPDPTPHDKRYRKSLRQMREMLRTGIYDILLVYHTDRFFRNTRWMLQMLQDDVYPFSVFASVTENFDSTTRQGKDYIEFISVANAFVLNRTTQRNQDAVSHRVQQGYYQGQVPYGWQWQSRSDMGPRDRRGILPIPEQGAVIKEMAQKYLGGESLRAIVESLNERGVPAPGESKPEIAAAYRTRGMVVSGKWSYSMVSRILTNPLNAGLIRSKKLGLVQGQHWEHRYFEPELRDKVLSTRDGRKKFAATNTGKEDSPLMLGGLPTCARCGKRLYNGSSSGKYSFYFCRGTSSTSKRTCPGVQIGSESLESVVLTLVENLTRSAPMKAQLLAAADEATSRQDAVLKEQRADLMKRERELIQQEKNLVGALARGTIEDDVFKDNIVDIRQNKMQVSAELQRIDQTIQSSQSRALEAQEVRNLALRFPKIWPHLSIAERREVMCQLVEKLTVDRDDALSGPLKGGHVTLNVAVKLALMPEQVLVLTPPKHKPSERPKTGLTSLTLREMGYLQHVIDGKPRKETAEAMRVSDKTIHHYDSSIRKRLGVSDIKEAGKLAKGYLHTKRDTLPMGPYAGPQADAAKLGDADFYLSPTLMQVVPMFGQGASIKDVVEITGLPASTVTGRKQMFLDITRSKGLYEAVQKARKAGYID